MIRIDFTVANLGELSTVHVAASREGANAWVDAEGEYFTLEKNSGATPGINVVAPLAGSPIAGAAGARWIRQTSGGGGGSSAYGLLVNRPTAMATNVGLVYFATDVLETFLCIETGAATFQWILLAPVSIVTDVFGDLPTATQATVGQLAITTGNGAIWQVVTTGINTYAWTLFVPVPSLFGLFSALPVASGLYLGATYNCTDNGEIFLCVGTGVNTFAWALISNTTTQANATAWSTQATWWINGSTGSDTNTGAVQNVGVGNAGPLQTLTEWFRRVQRVGGGVKAAMTVNIAAPLSTDEVRGTLDVYKSLGGSVVFSGTQGVTNIRNGTFSATTAIAPATNTPQQGTDSVGATWTAAISTTATTGKRVRNTTVGARLNSTFWPAKDLTAGACRFSTPYAAINLAAGPFGQAMSSLATNDTYALEQIPILTAPWGIGFNVDSATDGVTDVVSFIDLAWSGPSTGPIIQANSCVVITFYNCDISYLRVNSPTTVFVNCRMNNMGGAQSAGIAALGSTYLLAGVCFGILFIAAGNTGVADQRFMVQGASLSPVQILGPGFGFQSIQIFDGTGTAGILFIGSAFPCVGALVPFGSLEIFGVAGGLSGWRIPTGIVPYASKTGITLLGSGGASDAVALGATGAITQKTYASLPAIVSDVAAGAGTTFAGMIVQ